MGGDLSIESKPRQADQAIQPAPDAGGNLLSAILPDKEKFKTAVAEGLQELMTAFYAIFNPASTAVAQTNVVNSPDKQPKKEINPKTEA